jgi:hypothetical protein
VLGVNGLLGSIEIITYLVIREYKGVRNHDVFLPRRSENNDFGDVIWSKGIAATFKAVGSPGRQFSAVLISESVDRLTRRQRPLWPYRHKTSQQKTPSTLKLFWISHKCYGG